MSSRVSNIPGAIVVDDLSKSIKQAQAFAREGNVTAAELSWRQVLENYPESLAATKGLIKILDCRGDHVTAQGVLRSFISRYRTHANVLAAAQQWASWEKAAPAENSIRIALVGSGTLDPLAAYLRVAVAGAGIQPVVYTGEFGQWAQDILSPISSLYSFAPEVIILAIDTQVLFPVNASKFAPTADEIDAELRSGLTHIRELLATVERQLPKATTVLHTMAVPDYSPLGLLDLNSPGGQRERVQTINSELINLVRDRFKRVILLDVERIEARHGKANVRDERLWYLASIPYDPSFMAVLAREYVRTVIAIRGLTKKCIVLDLDNTLWGGVVGEDGYDGIKLGGTAAPGNAFADFQKVLDVLRQRGVLLALCSKNNAEDAWPVIDKHPGMVLKREHFAAVRINWKDKATNIIDIANELNIGLDSIVFLDDNPAERGLVRQQAPQVTTIDLPNDPAHYTKTLLGLDFFEVVALTEEDKRRGTLYQEQKARKQFEESSANSGDLKAYLKGLEIKAEVDTANSFTIPRIAQLINKTNQFNVTTRRYTEAEVRSLAEDIDNWAVYSINVSDRFGDSGLTGVALVKKTPEVWIIDSFLMSCRVLGRGIEDALLHRVVTDAKASGAQQLSGEYIRTEKNAPSSDFFANQGFSLTSESEHSTFWDLDLEVDNRSMPDWLN